MNFKKWWLAMWMLFIILNGCWELGHIGQYTILPPTPEEMIGWVNYPDVYVSHMAEDIWGNIWCSRMIMGPDLVRRPDGVYKFDGINWLVYSGQDIGVPDPVKVNDIYCSKDGKVYVALATGYPFDYKEGIGIFDGNKWTVIKESPSGLASNQVNCLCVDENNNLWAGTDKGLSMFNGTNWKTFTKSDGLLNDTILDVDYHRNKVFCFTKLGFAVYDGVSWTVANYDSLYYANCIKDFNGNIYLPKLGEVTGFTGNQCIGYWYYDGELWQFLSQERNSIVFAVDSKGKFWVSPARPPGTENAALGGVAKQTSSEWDEFYSYASWIYADSRGNSGLLDNGVWLIFIDSKNNKWFATGGGLSKYELE